MQACMLGLGPLRGQANPPPPCSQARRAAALRAAGRRAAVSCRASLDRPDTALSRRDLLLATTGALVLPAAGVVGAARAEASIYDLSVGGRVALAESLLLHARPGACRNRTAGHPGWGQGPHGANLLGCVPERRPCSTRRKSRSRSSKGRQVWEAGPVACPAVGAASGSTSVPVRVCGCRAAAPPPPFPPAFQVAACRCWWWSTSRANDPSRMSTILV